MALDDLTVPRLLICEGPSDVAFFRAFVESRMLPDFCMRHTAEGHPSGAGGVDTFKAFLNGLPSTTGFFELTDIVVVADCDSDPEGRFQYLCSQITESAPEVTPPIRYRVPGRANQRKRANQQRPNAGEPYMHVLLLPWAGRKGGLETLCLQSGVAKWTAEAECVNAFARCVEVRRWSTTKRAKMKLAALLAAVFQKNSNVAFGRIWIEGRREDLIPLDHPCFDRIERFLRSIAT